MKNGFHKITSLFLALLVLGSTMSFSVDKHYCGDHLIDVAIFGEAAPCEMMQSLDAKYGKDTYKKMGCCKNEQTVFEGQDELKMQFDQFTADQLVFLKAFTYSYTYLFVEADKHSASVTSHPPPLIITDYQVAYNQYLI
jgi:hypothetical protein